jgi:hypothetical protein
MIAVGVTFLSIYIPEMRAQNLNSQGKESNWLKPSHMALLEEGKEAYDPFHFHSDRVTTFHQLLYTTRTLGKMGASQRKRGWILDCLK